jgi:hypothetical protein
MLLLSLIKHIGAFNYTINNKTNTSYMYTCNKIESASIYNTRRDALAVKKGMHAYVALHSNVALSIYDATLMLSWIKANHVLYF